MTSLMQAKVSKVLSSRMRIDSPDMTQALNVRSFIRSYHLIRSFTAVITPLLSSDRSVQLV